MHLLHFVAAGLPGNLLQRTWGMQAGALQSALSSGWGWHTAPNQTGNEEALWASRQQEVSEVRLATVQVPVPKGCQPTSRVLIADTSCTLEGLAEH